MARWRSAPARVEPPEWYRNFHPEAWGEPDAEEIRMTAGCPGDMLPRLHDHHSRRRWHEAKCAYRRAHPQLATQELEDLMQRARERRAK